MLEYVEKNALWLFLFGLIFFVWLLVYIIIELDREGRAIISYESRIFEWGSPVVAGIEFNFIKPSKVDGLQIDLYLVRLNKKLFAESHRDEELFDYSVFRRVIPFRRLVHPGHYVWVGFFVDCPSELPSKYYDDAIAYGGHKVYWRINAEARGCLHASKSERVPLNGIPGSTQHE